MIDTRSMTDEEFQVAVLELVLKHLGLGAGARYIMLNLSGKGDYTRDRHLWLDKMTLEEVEKDLALAGQTKAA